MSTHEEVYTKVVQILKDQFLLPAEHDQTIDGHEDLRKKFQMDNLDKLELIIKIEDTFDLEIDDQDSASLLEHESEPPTVESLVNYVSLRLNNPPITDPSNPDDEAFEALDAPEESEESEAP